MTEYERIVSAVSVKPVGATIYDDRVTTVELDDECGGPYVVVRQRESRIGITVEEWPTIKEAIEELLQWCERQEKPKIAEVPHD